MGNLIAQIVNQIQKDKQRNRRMVAVLLVLSLFVTSGVLWNLKLTGITMTGEALCGHLEHQHTSRCLAMVEGCGLEESDDHEHTDMCLQEAYICGYETEHTHTPLCYSDVNADLESSSDWEQTIPELSGDYAADLVAVARSQLEYTESERNYKTSEDGTKKFGYTRYGEWYGNPYGNWNAMFVAFCMHYAQHPAYEALKNSGAESMRLAAEASGVYYAADEVIPSVGDLAFLDKDSNGKCGTVAIVSACSEEGLTVIEGDCNRAVAENVYSLENGTIMGYALLTPQPATLEENDDDLPQDPQNVNQADVTEDTVTIRFVIDNADYTQDPGSGNTHITAKSIEGFSDELTYTSWAGRYKITGTGCLVAYEIPANTTLQQNGYGLPGISVEDIGNTNTYAYGGRNWITEDKMICNDDTPFAEDTTLYLSLYPWGEVYGLNWVCNCTGTDLMAGCHSVFFNLSSKYPSVSFVLGESLSDNYILSADDVNSTYTGNGESCNVGSENAKVFTGWYLKNHSTQEEIPLTAGMPMLAEYVDPNSGGYTIAVYAHWEEGETTTEVTATFVNGDTTTTVVLNQGDQLGENLPEVTVPDGQIFKGWQIGDTAEYADRDTVIETDTTYTAIFADKLLVTFVNGETVVETRELEENAVLGELPADPETDESQYFLGWKAENADVFADAQMTIVEDITFYAQFGNYITVTFMHDDTQYEQPVRIPEGAKLWDYLPVEPPRYAEDLPATFMGWQIGDTEELVTEETVAESDVVLTAVFEVVEGFEVYLHDIAPDGITDYETADQDVLVSQTYLDPGTTLAENLAEYPYWMVHDGRSAAECKWYIKRVVDGEERFVPYDLNETVTSNLHLYTFNYEVILIRGNDTLPAMASSLFLVASAVDVEVDGDQLTLTLREGEKPIISDFVVGGADYSLYQWTYTDAQGNTQQLDVRQIIESGITENITATAEDVVPGLTTAIQDVHFFVSINDTWTLVEAKNMTVYSLSAGRYYLTAAQLESIFGQYGFRAEDLTSGTYLFGHERCRDNTNHTSTIWTANVVVTNTGVALSPLLVDAGNPVDVYFLAGNTTSYNNSGVNKNAIASAHSFHPVMVLDIKNLIYSDSDQIPPVQYIRKGDTVTVTLLDPPDGSPLSWIQVGSDKTLVGTPNGDGTSDYTITVNSQVYLSPYEPGLINIFYDINLQSEPVGTKPTINGSSSFIHCVVLQQNGSYVVQVPSSTLYTIRNGVTMQPVVFEGWIVNNDPSNMLLAGQQIDYETMQTYGNSMDLTAKWTTQQNLNAVSFYVNLELQVLDYDGSTGSTPNTDFTDVLYGTQLLIDPDPDTLTTGKVLEGASEKDTAAIDKTIRSLTEGVKVNYAEQERTFTLATFPNDEKILEKIRAVQQGYVASYNSWRTGKTEEASTVTRYRDEGNKIIWDSETGEYIPVEDLTSENYTIRWYVFKAEGNGWHVDGVLVKKQGQLTVTKTFYGDSTAVSTVKNTYSITVRENGGTTDIYTLNLNQKSEENPTGYTEYNAQTDTYVWVLPLTTNKEYVIYESGYEYTNPEGAENSIATLAEYRIVNPEAGTVQISGRTAYDKTSGVTVLAKAYNVDLDYSSYQMVQFFNSYIPTNAMPISKVDDSGAPLTGVSFQLYKEGEIVPLWRDNAGTYYIYPPNDSGVNATPVEDNNIEVDNLGYALVIGLRDEQYVGNYTFTLVEEVTPEGYGKIQPIDFKVDTDGTILLQGSADALMLQDGHTMRVINTANTMDVVVEKQWVDDTNAEVKVKLTLDGTPLSGYPELTLNAANDWTASWENVPTYVAGKLANYSVRETWIGNTAYNGSYVGGYDNYVVTVASPVYTYGENGLPETATIKVTNMTHRGGVVFTKVDENGVGLSGALFQLYTDISCEPQYAYAEGVRSDLYGKVNLGSLAAGTYYMREERPPAGYQSNTTVYKIVISRSGTVISVADDEKNTPIGNIVNYPASADLKIKKVDQDNNVLTGADFRLYMWNTQTNVWDSVTRDGRTVFSVDKNGLLTIPDLEVGDYKLVEHKAPAGYYRMTEAIEFNVVPGQAVVRDLDKDDCWSFDGETITVVNVTGSELPQTGGMGTHFVTMAGLLLMAFSLVYGSLLRRKRGRGAG